MGEKIKEFRIHVVVYPFKQVTREQNHHDTKIRIYIQAIKIVNIGYKLLVSKIHP